MANKRKQYTAEFKAKVVLELLEENLTINEIASKYSIPPKNVQQWKKQFLENAALAFDKSKVVKEYTKKRQRKASEKTGRSNSRAWLGSGKAKELGLID